MNRTGDTLCAMNQDSLAIIGIVLSTLGLLVSIGGFGLGFWQLHKIRTSAEAAARAVRRTERRISTNQILLVAGQLRSAEAELESHVTGVDRVGARKQLTNWRHSASELIGLLEHRREASEDLREALRHSVSLANSSKREIINEKVDLRGAADEVLNAIGEATSLLAEQVGKMTNDGLGDPE